MAVFDKVKFLFSLLRKLSKLDKFLLLLGILALFAFIFPSFAIIAAFSGIGIPLAIVLPIVPTIFLLLLFSRLVYKILPNFGRSKIVISLIAGALILTVPLLFHNMRMSNTANELVAGDLNNIKQPIRAKSIALRKKLKYLYSTSECDGFCLYALVNGVADKVLISTIDDSRKKMRMDEPVVEYSIQKLDKCTEFRSSGYRLNFDFNYSDSSMLMKLGMLEGYCLVARNAQLRDAELIISSHILVNGKCRRKVGLSLLLNGLCANRISAHLTSENGENFIEIYRKTVLSYRIFSAPYIPVPIGYGFNLHMGWQTETRMLNIAGKKYKLQNFPNFMTQTLGISKGRDLEGVMKAGDEITNRLLDAFNKIQNENRKPTKSESKLFRKYFFGKLVFSTVESDLIISMLKNKHFPVLSDLHRFSTFVREYKDIQASVDLASVLLSRLTPDDHKVKTGDSFALKFALEKLPDEAFTPNFDKLVQLLDGPDLGRYAYEMTKKLGLFGEKSVPILIKLVEKGLKNPKGVSGLTITNKKPYLAGIQGLCVAGENATSGLPRMMQFLKNDQLAFRNLYGILLIKTLVRMGAIPDDIWPYYSAADAKNRRNRERFDRLVKQARSGNPDCNF